MPQGWLCLSVEALLSLQVSPPSVCPLLTPFAFINPESSEQLPSCLDSLKPTPVAGEGTSIFLSTVVPRRYDFPDRCVLAAASQGTVRDCSKSQCLATV